MLGRLDDVIITGGEKVAPAAVERVLLAQPGVRAACVVGLPDPEWGQVVAAAVVVDPAAARPTRPAGGGGARRARARGRAAPAAARAPGDPAAGHRQAGPPAVAELLVQAHRSDRVTARPYTIGALTLR